MTQKILILSDSASCTSGLGRITRDLALRLHADGVQVATLGYGGPGSVKLPFPQYHVHDIEHWLVPELPLVWEDWFGDEPGTLLTIWDPSRLRWLARPEACPPTQLGQWVRQQRSAGMLRLWGYIPMDAAGPQGKLPGVLADTLQGYDRILCYSRWAATVLQRTFDIPVLPDWLPHGIDAAAFATDVTRAEARAEFRQRGFVGLQDSSLLVGMVATNQARKDFGLGLGACAELLAAGRDVRVWIHTDALKRHWDLSQLPLDLGLVGRVMITTSRFSDQEMARAYRACDITLGIGLGEGFGLPIFESLACGTPVVHGDYGGAPEHLPDYMKATPIGFRLEGQYGLERPMFKPDHWARRVEKVLAADLPVGLPLFIEWQTLWPHWREWFVQGGICG